MKCRICGKKFDSLSSLREHHRTVHPNSRFTLSKTPVTRTVLVSIIVILIAVSGIVGYLIYAQAQNGNSTTNNGLLGTPIPSSLYANLTSVSYSTLASIGPNQSGVTAPAPVPGGSSSQLLGPNGKPEVLYIGGEWCPFCGAERWSLIVALSKFGNFTGLKYMQSSSSDSPSDINTFTFFNSTYTSQFISFVAVEHQDRNHNLLQATTGQQQSLWDGFTQGKDGIPFLYFDGQYYLNGAQFKPDYLSNLNWSQISTQLNNPQSPLAQQIDGAANQIIGTICSALKTRSWPTPQTLCSQSFATLAFNVPSSPTSILSFVKEYTNVHLNAVATTYAERVSTP